MTCHIYGPQNVFLQRKTFLGSWIVSRSWMKISCHQVEDSNWKTRISILWAIAGHTILVPIHILISIWMPRFLWNNQYLFVDWSRQVLKMANSSKLLLEFCFWEPLGSWVWLFMLHETHCGLQAATVIHATRPTAVSQRVHDEQF
jgi:hypothetical protein